MNETPTDTAAPPTMNPEPAKVPQRGKRKRVLGSGEGDYCIADIVGEGHKTMPKGALVPIPGVPRFIDTNSAMKWIRTSSGDLLHGKQVMIYRACEILTLQVQAQPTLVIQAKAKTVVKDPAAPKAEGGSSGG